jgi:hypothetical protein
MSVSTKAGGNAMKKTLFIAAASLFVIGQAMAQNQPSGQQSSQPSAAQSGQMQNAPRTAKSRHMKKTGHHAGMKRGTHRMAHHPRSQYMRSAAGPSQQPQQQGFFGPPPGQQQGWNQQGWGQQGWNQNQPQRRSQRQASNQQQGFFGPGPGQQQSWNQNWDQQNRQSRQRTSGSQETFGWNPGGPCKNNRRADGTWC